jgi:hypothetical protein
MLPISPRDDYFCGGATEKRAANLVKRARPRCR